ncbi:hypothetical protein LZ554_002747 [Drepanopeziza brunnea f. sp. 'monogermtubi']|nr:hypothetical protein LZ554_002747 [Drepanopeziza brunnea f. sp. 'monogermtubi']
MDSDLTGTNMITAMNIDSIPIPEKMETQSTLKYELNETERQKIREHRTCHYSIARRGPDSEMDCEPIVIDQPAMTDEQRRTMYEGRLARFAALEEGYSDEMACESSNTQELLTPADIQEVIKRRIARLAASRQELSDEMSCELFTAKEFMTPTGSREISEARVRKFSTPLTSPEIEMDDCPPDPSNNMEFILRVRELREKSPLLSRNIDTPMIASEINSCEQEPLMGFKAEMIMKEHIRRRELQGQQEDGVDDLISGMLSSGLSKDEEMQDEITGSETDAHEDE